MAFVLTAAIAGVLAITLQRARAYTKRVILPGSEAVPVRRVDAPLPLPLPLPLHLSPSHESAHPNDNSDNGNNVGDGHILGMGMTQHVLRVRRPRRLFHMGSLDSCGSPYDDRDASSIASTAEDEARIVVWIFQPQASAFTSPSTTIDGPRESSPVVIMSFGNSMSLDTSALFVADDLQRANPRTTVVFWDYGGVGRSSGASDPSFIEDDSTAVLQFVLEHETIARALQSNAAHLVCWGHSLGSWAASNMARVAQSKCARLVLSAPFASLSTVSKLAILVGFARVAPSQNVQRLNPFTTFVLVHASDDDLFPPQHAEELERAYTSTLHRRPFFGMETLTVQGGHNSTMQIQAAVRASVAPFKTAV